MQVKINGASLELVQGDVTLQEVDAIVNAANQALAGGSGVDGAIHRRGGSRIILETDRLYPQGCPTGSAVVSGAGDLSANYVFHAVGPRWNGGNNAEAELLASAYQQCLSLACEKNCRSIAFPSLSTGAYCFPLSQAATIALTTTISFLRKRAAPELVRFVLFNRQALKEFEQALGNLQQLIEP